MPTPNFKLLLHALRLGQPAEPTSAIRALAEEIAAQEDQLEDLRSKLAILGSHLQFVEARAARLEAPPQAHDAYGGGPATAPRSAPPSASAAAALEAYEASLAALAPRTAHGGTQGPSMQGASMQGPSTHGPSTSASASAAAAHPASVARAQHSPDRAASHAPPVSLIDAEESSVDGEYKNETLVVNRRDIEALRGHEAPFRLPPPGARGAPEARRSIPGAPWARGARGAEPASRSLHEDYTVDMPGGARDADDLDDGDGDDTFRDRGEGADRSGHPLDPNAPRRR